MSIEKLIELEQSYVSKLFENINNSYSSKNPLYTIKEKIKFIDLFAGIGGMRSAFSSDKSRCVFSSEWDKYARKTYQENFGEIPYGDINSIEPGDIPDHDILIAGFPCQPFSTIGKREGFLHKTQGTLFHSIVNI